MESLLEKYSDKIAKLRESRSKWPHTTKKGAKRKAPMASSRSEDKKRQIDYQKHFTKNADGTRDCNLCSMNLKQRHAAASHIKLKHGFNSNYKCHLCQKPFEFPVPLASHMFEYHAEVLPHQATCVICHGAVTFEKNRHDVYNDHVIGCMKTFENQKKYIWKMNGGLPPCDICNKVRVNLPKPLVLLSFLDKLIRNISKSVINLFFLTQMFLTPPPVFL